MQKLAHSAIPVAAPTVLRKADIGELESSSVPVPVCRTMSLECRTVADFSADGQVVKTRAANELSDRDRVPCSGL